MSVVSCASILTRSLASPHARRRGPEKLQGGVTTIPAAAGTGAALAREQRQRGGGARRGRRRQDGGPPHEPPRPERGGGSRPPTVVGEIDARGVPPAPRGPPRQRRRDLVVRRLGVASRPVHDAVRSNESRRGTSTCGSCQLDPPMCGSPGRRPHPDRDDTDGPTPAATQPTRASNRGQVAPETGGGAQDPERRAGVGRVAPGPQGQQAGSGAASGIRPPPCARGAARAAAAAAARAAAPTCRARASR